MRDDERENWVGAYLRERAALACRGLVDRVAQVDAELARLGYVAPPERAEVPPKRTAAQPRKRTTRG